MDSNSLVLEILRQENLFKMSIFQKQDLASTVRHYSQRSFSIGEINRLCQEIVCILNKANKKGLLENEALENLRKTGQLFWEHFFTREVKEKLKASSPTDLILSLDDDLINIPWELVFDGEQFLCLKFNLGRLVRTKQQVRIPQYRSLSHKPKMLILANPTGDLKSSYLEGVNIRNQFDTKRSQISIYFKSTDADSLYVKKNLRDYDIVHFAGHCEYDPNDPRNTGWVLSDRIFSAKDILVMGEDYSLPSLVFSNACQSAKSDSGTINPDYQTKTYSLASAFLFSGVRHYIGTSRKIEDQVSFLFAKEFYSQLIRHKAVGECMRLSRLRLIKEYGINSIFWASYLLYGDPNFILLKPKPKGSPLSFKKENFFSGRPLIIFLLLLVILSILTAAFFYFPLRYPREYFNFLNSKELFDKGENIKVMRNCEAIIKKDPLFLDAYILLADTHTRLGQSDLAIKDYFDLALYGQKKNDVSKVSSAYIGIGWIYQQEGKYSKAMEFYNKALAIAKESGNKLNEAIVLRKMAVWNIGKDNNDEALVLLTKSSEINRQRQYKNEHKYHLACDYFDIGLVLENKDEFASSREFYLKSKTLFEEIKAANELSDYYFNLGEVYLFEKNYQKALESYMVGLKIDQLKDNRPSLAADYNMIGELYMEMGNLAEAENYFNKTILLASQIKVPQELAAAYYDLGVLNKRTGNIKKTRDFFNKAIEIYHDIETSDFSRVTNELNELPSDTK